jgi:competence protein ComEC
MNLFEGLILSIIVLFGLMMLRFGKRLITYLGLGIVFIALGFVNGNNNRFSSLSEFENMDQTFLVEVKDIKKGKRWNRILVDLKGVYADENFHERDARLLLYVKTGDLSFTKGVEFCFNGSITKIKNKGNPGEFNSELYWKSKGVYHIVFLEESRIAIKRIPRTSIFDKAEELQARCSEILKRRIDEKALGVAKALLLGDKSSLDTLDYQAFGNTGAMHLLAVSGLHIGILLECILFVLLRFPRLFSRKSAFLIALLILWFYAVLTGMSPSVLRAVFMFSLLVVGRVLERKESGLNMLGLSAFVLLLINPYYLLDIGFQLSYLAMLGIFIMYPKIVIFFNCTNKWVMIAWKGIALGLAAQLTTAPLTLYYFHQFPNYFLLTNLLILLLANGIMITGILTLAFYFIPIVNLILAACFSFLLYVLLVGVYEIESFPASVAYGFNLTGFHVLCCFCILIFLCFEMKRKWVFKIRLCLFVVGISFLIFNRFETIETDKLFFMNTNYPLIVLRKNSENHCFFDKKVDVEKSKYLIQQYAKVYPGKLVYHELSENWVVTGESFSFRTEKQEEGISILLNSKQFFLRTGISGFGNSTNGYNSYKVLSFFDSIQGEYSLRNGAFVYDF